MCYKVSAVSVKGLEGALTEQFCFDNCPNYVLPNVFTPNGDGCNDEFSAFSLRGLQRKPDGAMFSLCGSLDITQEDTWQRNCARFVKAVSFRVYSRWGKMIYSYQSDTTHSIYIDWNGKDNLGADLDGGTYYYTADIVFETIDPLNQNTSLKGWLTIIR